MTSHKEVLDDAEEHADFLMKEFGHQIYMWAYLHGYKHGYEQRLKDEVI